MEHNFPIPVLKNKDRCPHVAIHLECNVGGNATAQCFVPSFHENCEFRKRYEAQDQKGKKLTFEERRITKA